MSGLRIQWSGGELYADPTQSYIVGRGQVADVVIDDPGVSRHHLDLAFDGRSWLVKDRSSAGSFVDGQRFETLEVIEETTVRLGGDRAPEIRLTPEPGEVPVLEVSGESYAGTVALDDRALRLDLAGEHAVFMPGTRVVVGRNAECDVSTSNQLVSGEHCAFEHDGDQWIIEDLGSTRGTFIDGRRITRATPVEGAFFVGLGDPSAGEPLRVVTAGEHRTPPDRRMLLLIGSAIAVILIVVLGVTLTRDSETNSDAELRNAKAATVFIGTDLATGSGAFVTTDLVLTNRHVIEGALVILIAVSPEEDRSAEWRYEAEIQEIHPYLDVAVLRIIGGVETENGIPIGPGPMPSGKPDTLDIGTSDDLRIGDPVTALGFPAVAGIGVLDESGQTLPTTAVSEGAIVSYQLWPGCDRPDPAALLVEGGASSGCAPDGDLERGNLVTDDLSGSGGSGGPVITNGEIVAIRYAVGGDLPGTVSTGGIALSIPVEYFGDWLQGQIAG